MLKVLQTNKDLAFHANFKSKSKQKHPKNWIFLPKSKENRFFDRSARLFFKYRARNGTEPLYFN